MPGKVKYTLGQDSVSLHDLTLPSGATCQARRPGVQGLIEAGLLDNFDQLTALVQSEHIGPKTGSGIASQPKVTADDMKAAADAMMVDKEKLTTALILMDKLAVYVVTQPPLWVDYKLKDEDEDEFNRRSEAAAKSGAIPVRSVDIDDKSFLLQWSTGGSADLTSFREGLGGPLDGLAAIKAI